MEKRYNYLIIGGGIAGTTTAETIRAADHIGSIALIEREPHLLYSRILLPQFTEGIVTEEKLFLRRLGDYEAKKIDIFPGETIVKVDADKHETYTESGRVFYFDKLLIAAGGRVRPWAFEKTIADYVVRLQTLDDAKKIVAFVEKFRTVSVSNTKGEVRRGRILIVGGGFISLDLIDIFAKLGLEIVFVLRSKRFWENSLDETGSKILHDLWRSKGFDLIFDDEIANLACTAAGIEIMTKRGEKRLVDLVGVGVGLERNFDMVCDQVAVGQCVKVNEFMETSRPGIWAAGDVTEYFDTYAGETRMCVGWGEAFAEGRVAGFNMTLGADQKEKRQKMETVAINTSDHLSAVIATIGSVIPKGDEQLVTRYHAITGRYARFILKNNIMIGAILINAQNLLGPCSRLIKARKDLAAEIGYLADSNFDLATIK
ncbi:MAG: FAD-dependent oxidoreductase [Candidatus Niyogibacteria bacterium]|nr:FAD-dependent oxidoreductase [Candidatus Niyogibacteria bacterium]